MISASFFVHFADQKKLKVEEFLPIYSQCKKDKDVGNIEDFKEVLKLYDKNENGQMYFDELKHILQSLGKLRTHFRFFIQYLHLHRSHTLLPTFYSIISAFAKIEL